MTRPEKRRRFLGWLSETFLPAQSSQLTRRKIVVEPLENRQLLAADGFMALLGSSYGDMQSEDNLSQGNLVGEGELSAEGEDAPDLVAFARALADSGTRFFGAAWCEFCTQQKELFEDGGQFLPFIEVTNPDRTPNQIAGDEGITEYPTWEFPDGTRVTGVQTLETLAQRSEVAIPSSSTPSFNELPNVSVGLDSPLHVPVDAYDPNGNPLTITVSSSDPGLVTAEVLSGNRSLRLSTAGFGDLVFELFEDRAPVPTGRVIELAQADFYDDVIFHRIINNFVIQGGDPTGTGSGGSTLGDFDDQFNLELQHNRTGVLSYAKSSDDTNDSQFFITEGPQRFLDFNHSVFGQLVEGELNREAISNTSVNSSDRPTNDVVIEDAQVFTDTENGIILLKPTGSGTGTATITVTVTDTEGLSTSRTFVATVGQDTANGAPFLDPIQTVETPINTPATVNLSSQDSEGDTVVYSVTPLGSQTFGLSVDSATGVVTVTPPTDFTGELQFRATVQQTTTPTTSSTTDNQVVSVLVAQGVPTGVDLNAGSDSGADSTDDVTNAQTLVFTVSGTTPGSLVELRAGGSVVGSATASGSTTEVTVSNVAALGQGSIAFTSTQTINSQTSGESPALTVNLDSVAPVTLGSGVFPANTIIDQPLNVNLSHPEEGQGVLYSLASPLAGMSIDSQTGAFAWTPTSSQLGAQTVTVELTDTAGNLTSQDFTINVIEEPQIEITLNTVDLTGAPVTTVATGETFKVQVVLQDLRPGADRTGVFAAYLDLLFDSNIVEPIASNPIEYITPYSNDLSGTVLTGEIDELGAFSASTSPIGSDSRVLAEITFVAIAAGNASIRAESADDPGNDILLYDESSAVPLARVSYGANNFAVGANFDVVDDSFNFDEDSGTQVLDVLANDTVTGTAVLTISDVGIPDSGGTVSIASDGLSLNYESAGNFNGAEVLTYTVENQDGVAITGTVTVQVTDVNDPPVALNDSFEAFQNSSQNVLDVLSNDNSGVDDSNAETLTISSVGAGSNGGTIVIGSSGLTLRYTPANGFTGTETFTYTLSDGRGGTSNATVSVSVDQANPPPTAQNDNFTVEEDAAQASFDVLSNDSTDDTTETLSVSAVGASQVGSQVSVASNGLGVLYAPAANFSGQEIITYTLQDSGGATTTGLITFTVNAVNDPPIAVDDSVTALSANTTTTFEVLANDQNVDSGETLTITAVTQPPAGMGSLAISSDGQTIVYTSPSNDFENTFSFTYTIDDGNALTDTATVSVDVRAFLLRSISGTVNYGSGVSSQFPLTGTVLTLSGSDLSGSAVSETTTVQPNGSYSFPDLAPGNYQLTRAPLPFLNDAGATVEIASALNDGDMTEDLFVGASLRPQFFDIRDFLGSTMANSLTVAVNADGSSNWMTPRGAWGNFSTLTVQVDAGGNTLQVSGTDGNQQAVSGSIPITGSRAVAAGTESSHRLIKLFRSPSSAGLQAGSTTASSASTLAGEGEFSGVASPSLTSPAAPQIVSARRLASNVTRLNAEGEATDFGGSMSTVSNSAEASSPIVATDLAMASVMPALQLQLSSDLENTLTDADAEDFGARDSIFGALN